MHIETLCNQLLVLFQLIITEALFTRVVLNVCTYLYQVENYAVLPSQRDTWLELQQAEALRTLEMENDDNVFRPWEEEPTESTSLERSQIQ